MKKELLRMENICLLYTSLCAGGQGSGALNGRRGRGQYVGGSVRGCGRVGHCHTKRNESPVTVISVKPFGSEEIVTFRKYEKSVSGTCKIHVRPMRFVLFMAEYNAAVLKTKS